MIEQLNNANLLNEPGNLEPQLDAIHEESKEEIPSFDEALHQAPQEAVQNKESEFDLKRKELSSKLSPIAYTVSSVYHVLMGLGMASLRRVRSGGGRAGRRICGETDVRCERQSGKRRARRHRIRIPRTVRFFWSRRSGRQLGNGRV